MNLEHQVVSLDLSKRLKELGVKQESYFWWVPAMYTVSNDWEIRPMHRDGYNRAISAFTVAELGGMLPSEIEVGEVSYYLRVSHGLKDYWEVAYCNSRECYMPMAAEQEAEARALMLIYLLEKGLVANEQFA